jgi:hypothetical protein
MHLIKLFIANKETTDNAELISLACLVLKVPRKGGNDLRIGAVR